MYDRPVIVGIYGGVASGKNLISSLFVQMGAEEIDADKEVHKVLKYKSVRRKIKYVFGTEVFNPKGYVDRSALAKVVFDDKQALEALEDIVIPPVINKIRKKIDSLSFSTVPAIILNAPMLRGSDLECLVDYGVYIDAPLEIRDKRAQETRGWEPGEVYRRESKQPSREDKMAVCKYTIVNDTNEIEAHLQVIDVWKDLFDLP